MIRAAIVFATSIVFLLFAQTASAATPHVAIADATTCFVTDAGAVSCQGDNAFGQLAQPVSVTASSTPLPVAGLPPVTHLEAADEFFCSLGDVGQVHCWGAGTVGQIGDGTSTDAYTPTPVSGVTGALQIDGLDDAMRAALFPGGAVKCWGQNSEQFGGAYAIGDYPTPVDIAGFAGSSTIAQGDDVLCGLFAGGTVRCQGNNDEGQAGQPIAAVVVATPTEVPGITGAIDVAAGEDFTCALLGDCTARCWGDGADGRLGQGPTSPTSSRPWWCRAFPAPSSSNSARSTRAPCAATARCSAGVSRRPGSSVRAQTSSTWRRRSPASDPRWTCSSGYDGACALLVAGSVACWGDNPGRRIRRTGRRPGAVAPRHARHRPRHAAAVGAKRDPHLPRQGEGRPQEAQLHAQRERSRSSLRSMCRWGRPAWERPALRRPTATSRSAPSPCAASASASRFAARSGCVRVRRFALRTPPASQRSRCGGCRSSISTASRSGSRLRPPETRRSPRPRSSRRRGCRRSRSRSSSRSAELPAAARERGVRPGHPAKGLAPACRTE